MHDCRPCTDRGRRCRRWRGFQIRREAEGFANDDNSRESFEFANGDWGTGLGFALSVPLKDNLFLGVSGAYEFNLSDSGSSISFDVGLSFAF